MYSFAQKNMKITLSLFLLLIPSLIINAQQTESNVIFRGGMMLHSGYLQNNRSTQTINGACYGIGGQLSYTLDNNFRLGSEGYASNSNYGDQDGYYKLGWGGLLLGYQFNSRKIRPVISLTLGGGKVKDMFIIEGNTSDNANDVVVFRKYPVMLATPAVSVEYAIKERLSLVLKIDYLIPLFSSNYSDFAYGPRLYLGILFNRS
jgi:hypothetical protein